MNRFFLILFFIPFSLFAKFYPGSITLYDGVKKNGFLEIPHNYNDDHIRFRLEKNGKTENFEIDYVRSFEIVNDRNTAENYIPLYLGNPDSKGDIYIAKKKSWVKIIKEGKISIYSATLPFLPDNASRGIGYYIKRQNEHHGLYLGVGKKGFNFCSDFNTLKNILKVYFEKDCPALFDLIISADLQNNGLGQIVELYEQNCGAK
ncbi:hypothetical protein [Flavobacterium sp. GT3R68]|uniref:hypothetical protein n=1 Tax=Flavobacterium sp. GT3R68 TaxID=2594437 RepID=UPI000F8828E4|nr:hypothetical protein [Flavobacterium sp. GT3R68]RTY93413.1 hypothetical protein EKL32_16285 [Flavobacterium sp. GSN2]TRW92413.1 hypothetical protein FNW07_05255 [Flavobacterium sp. GT3R68]